MGNSAPGGCTGSADVAESNRNRRKNRQSQSQEETPIRQGSAESLDGASPQSPPPAKGPEVKVHVYNLRPGKGHVNTKIGFGIFHSGIEVLGREWSFGGSLTASPVDSGVFFLPPEMVLPKSQKYKTITLGYLPDGATHEVIALAVRTKMLKDWRAETYHVLNHNCNHFSEAFVDVLNSTFNVSLVVPGWINRAARIADVLVPEKVLRQLTGATPQAPVNHSEGTSAPRGYTAAEALYGSSSRERVLDDFLLAPNGQPLLDFNGYDPERAKKEFWEKYRAQEQESRREQEDELRKEFTVPTTREAASAMSVKHLKTVMWINGIDWSGCFEKEDLINALLQSNTENGETTGMS